MGAGWSAAAAGEPTVLMIVGEAGIGKTRLAREAIDLAESTGGLVLQARCYAAERSLFVQPFRDAVAGRVATRRPDRLRELPGARAAAYAGLLPAAGQVFGPRPAERAAPEAELRRAYQGVTDMLGGLGDRRREGDHALETRYEVAAAGHGGSSTGGSHAAEAVVLGAV